MKSDKELLQNIKDRETFYKQLWKSLIIHKKVKTNNK